jgi:prevent-host-death family protein
MKQVGLRELKNRLSAYVRRVRAGEHIRVTDRGQVVAELVPPGAMAGRDPASVLAELERRGVLRPPTAKGLPRYPRFRRQVPPGTARRLLDEERADR